MASASGIKATNYSPFELRSNFTVFQDSMHKSPYSYFMSEEIFSNELVIGELEKILASKPFKSSKVLSRFLRFVVCETLEGRDNQLKEYTIGKEVLLRHAEFSPQKDPSIRIHAIRLRKLIHEYYLQDGKNSLIRIELPKGTYKPVFAVPDSYNDYYQPEYIKRNKEDHIPEDFICITPFTGLIGSEYSEFSTTGFCEFLSEKLSLFQDIKVLSFHSVTRFLDTGGTPSQLGIKLGVGYYLSGSIEFRHQNFQVSIQLYDAQSNMLIWSHEFNEPFVETAIMDIVDGITTKIVSSLAGYSGYIHYRKFVSNGYEYAMSNKMALAVFWFYRYQAHHSEEVFHEAIQQLEAGISKEPYCALCLAVVAHLYSDGVIYNYITIGEPIVRAQEYLNRAFKLNPNCQEGHLTQAWVHILCGEREKAISSIEKCISINPNSSYFLASTSLGMAMTGEYERSITLWEKAIPLSPLPYWWLNLPKIFIAIKNNNYQEALFHSSKPGTPKMIYEQVFEMISLYFLHDFKKLAELAILYKQKFPGGLEFVSRSVPMIIFDEDLKMKVSHALQEIRENNYNLFAS